MISSSDSRIGISNYSSNYHFPEDSSDPIHLPSSGAQFTLADLSSNRESISIRNTCPLALPTSEDPDSRVHS